MEQLISSKSELRAYIEKVLGHRKQRLNLDSLIDTAVFDEDGHFRGMLAGPLLETMTMREVTDWFKAMNCNLVIGEKSGRPIFWDAYSTQFGCQHRENYVCG